MLDKLLGAAMLLAGIVAVIATYHKHMKAIYADIAEEDAECMANQMFEQMKRGMKIHVRQQLRIVDEMGRRTPHESRDEEVSA